MSAEDLKKLSKQLQAATVEEDILGILSILKKDFQVSDAILRESKAGLTVGKLRSHKSKAVSEAAKELVKKWKTEVERAKAAAGTSINTKVRKGTSTPGISTPATPTVSTPKAEVFMRTAKSDGIMVNSTGDKTRDKCIELMYDAIASDSNHPSDLILTRAKAIEEEVYALYDRSPSSPGYKGKLRSLLVNLKDKHNPGLRESVVSGSLSASKLAKLTSQEMASGERQAADQKIREENLFNSLGAEDQQAETDGFQCGKCKQRKCRYRQAQTRSADEPMTTFVTCTNCNNRWKFS